MEKVKDRWQKDGLNSLRYNIIKKERQPLFTWIYVDLLEQESRAELQREKIC